MNFEAHPVRAAMPAPAREFAEEAARLAVLADFPIAELEDDAELQAIVDFAARLCKVPTSLISLLDDRRQYFVARTGLDARETPREVAFCNHVLGRADMMEVPDAEADPRFAANPLVTGDPHIRYYAGQPLVSDEGAPLGTLCVIGMEARDVVLDDFQRQGMAVLAQAAMRRLQARREEAAAIRAIAQEAENFRALAESMPAISFSASADGKVDYLNRQWEEYTGIADMFDPVARLEALHPDEREQVLGRWQQALASGEAFVSEHRMRRPGGSFSWVLLRARPVEMGNGHRWFGTITDIDRAHKEIDARDMLARELAHRIKNIFAVVSGLISLEARKHPENAAFAERVNDTLRALGRAHDFVRPASGEEGGSLKGMLEVIFAPYRDAAGGPRILLAGDDITISEKAVTPLALVFHELATNSAKYGALKVAGGKVSLTVATDGKRVVLVWKDIGGEPPAGEPGATGFGSRMVDLSVRGQLQGSWERRFEPDGMLARFDLCVDAIGA